MCIYMELLFALAVQLSFCRQCSPVLGEDFLHRLPTFSQINVIEDNFSAGCCFIFFVGGWEVSFVLCDIKTSFAVHCGRSLGTASSQ